MVCQRRGYLETARIWIKAFARLVLLALICADSSRSALATSWDDFARAVPGWPISHIGSEIPPALINWWQIPQNAYTCEGKADYSPFPSKPLCDPSDVKHCLLKPASPASAISTQCDDADTTLFSGLLCAAGVEEGCRSVKQAQDAGSGMWVRSPRRRWVVENWCPHHTNLPDSGYCEECVNAFSRDHGLGAMLYVIHAKDYAALRRWYGAMESAGRSTQICKDADIEHPAPCKSFPWPRYCRYDTACVARDKHGAVLDGESKLPKPLFGYVSNMCVLIPVQDSPDYDLMARTTDTQTGKLMTRALQSDDLLEAEFTALGTAALAAPGAAGFPVVAAPGTPIVVPPQIKDQADAYFVATNFPLHLEAVRVLLRMVINNPSLSLSNLPPLPPDAAHLAVFPDSPVLTTDPIVLHQRAKTIFDRQSWNPFYSLLYNGPTESVKNSILQVCPAMDDPPLRDRLVPPVVWRWETGTTDQLGVEHSMGWDCVFLGSLYNKMRVRQNLANELISVFERYVDPLNTLLSAASQAAAELQSKYDQAEQLYAQASAALQSAHDIAAGSLNQQISQLKQESASIRRSVGSLSNQYAQIQNQLNNMGAQVICPPLLPGCNDARKRLKQTADDLTAQINSGNQRVIDLGNQLQTLNSKVAQAGADLANRTFEQSMSAQQAVINAVGAQLRAANDNLNRLKFAYARVIGYLNLWKGT
ncbi:hypothetical protein SAMN05444172_5432 [Burkholderia sp. GAS332]|nr:hypothetical protein SAMN05444172_5432 [Burkholderia sp. GAS332]